MPLISISIVCGVKTLRHFSIVSCDDSATLLVLIIYKKAYWSQLASLMVSLKQY